jgi:glycosyltransferase involved in cell wall biosynthesis
MTSHDTAGSAEVELSVVMPCLNEAETLESCIRKASDAFSRNGIAGEIVVADNGSSDGSPDIAARLGARVVNVPERGYGNALRCGIEAARGKYVIMGDADDSYDFGEIHKFLDRLREGFDLVQGCRLESGGGHVMPGAMPWSHRWIGNPLFSYLAQKWFHAPIHDVYCGLRGFTKDCYIKMDLRCSGMEFATEMIIKASLLGFKLAEVPITLHKDGRKAHKPHLRTFQDGWRTLRFFLLYSPRWLFLAPGAFLISLGLLAYVVVLFRLNLGSVELDAHTLLFGTLFMLSGYQAVLFAVLAKTFAIRERLLPIDERVMKLYDIVTLERGLLISALGLVAGTVLLLLAINQWRLAGFGHLEYARTMRLVVPGATLFALGLQTIFSSFLISILGMHRR